MFTSLNCGALGISVPLDAALDLAAANGFEALDLQMSELVPLAEQTSAEEVRNRFNAAGVRPGAWGLPVDFRGSEESYRAGLDKLRRYATVAQVLGTPWCSTWILPFSDSLDYDENMNAHAERLRPAAQILADYGCRLALEFVGPRTMRAGHRYEFIYTIEGALDLAARLNAGNIGLLLDAFHWYTSGGTLEDVARLSAQQVVYVHVNDGVQGRSRDEQMDQERALPGATGLIDIVAFLRTLDGIGFDGPIAVEPFDAELQKLPVAERVQAARDSLRRTLAAARG